MNEAYRLAKKKHELIGWLGAFGVPYSRAEKIAKKCVQYYHLMVRFCNEDIPQFEKKEEKIINAIRKELQEYFTDGMPYIVEFSHDPRGAVVVFTHVSTDRVFYF